MGRREQLLMWIAQTKRNQRRLAVIVGVLGVLSIAAGTYRTAWGTIGGLTTALFAIVSFWVTASHLADWRYQLEQLRKQRG